MFKLKKVQRSYLSWHWRVIQNLKKNWLVVGKWQEEFDKSSPEPSKVSKLGLWWDPFIQSSKCMTLWAWHEKFDKFWPAHLKVSKICTLMGSFWRKYIMLELKKYRKIIFDSTEDWRKIWRKTNLCFQKWHADFGKFSQDEK